MVRIPFLLAVLSSKTLASASCPAPPPVILPITNVSLSNGQTRRGVEVGVGTPAQNLSFFIQGWSNDTWVYNTSTVYQYNGSAFTNQTFCDYVSTPAECLTLRGGWYNQSASTSMKNFADVSAAGGDPGDTMRRLNSWMWYSGWVQDTLTISDSIVLPAYPLGIPAVDPLTNQNYIGLGRNSVFLNQLKDHGHIASRSFGYWFGQTGASTAVQMDGQLTFGGYDAAKTQGPNYTFPIQPYDGNCPSGIYFNISSINLQSSDGSSPHNLLSTSAASTISACYSPDDPTMLAMTELYFDDYQSATHTLSVGVSDDINRGATLFDPDNVYTGSIQFSIQDGPTIDVPNDLLVVPPTYIASSTGQITINSSFSELLIRSDQNFFLGKQFSSMIYLFVNYDTMQYTFWQANATDGVNLVSVGENCTQAPTSGSNGGQGPETSENPSEETSDDGASLSNGAIAGIVVGAVATFALVAVAIWLVWRRRRRFGQYDKARSGSNDGSYTFRDHKEAVAAPGELPSDCRPHEVDGKYAQVYEMHQPATELP